MHEFRSFWHGGPLSPYEQACMASFIAKGQRFVLYTYMHDLAVPDGVERRDAGEILPFAEYCTYGPEAGEGAGSPSLFANRFRYALLAEMGGWWVDTDVYLLGAEVPDVDIFAAWQSSGIINAAVMRFPAGHPIMVEALHRTRQMGTEVAWGEAGPFLVTELFEAHGANAIVRPMASAYPIHPSEAMDVLRPSRTTIVRERVRGSTFLHLWNEALRRRSVDKWRRPPVGSLLREIYDATDVDGWVGEYPGAIFDEHPNDGSIRIAACNRQRRRWIVRIMKLLGCSVTVNSTSGV